MLTKIGSLGAAALGCDPLKDGDVPVIEAGWKAFRSRRRYYDLRMSDRRCERRKIGINVVSVRLHRISRKALLFGSRLAVGE